MKVPVYDVLDPATLEVVGQAPEHTEEDVRQSIATANLAAAGWAADRESRRSTLREVAARIRTRAPQLGRILSLEQGKVLSEAIGEFQVAADLFEYYANMDWDETEALPERAGRKLQVQYRPVGLVGTITPWNFPISLLCVKLAPALVAGCTVIAKPSATTPLSTIALVELANELLPEGVLQVRTSSRRTVNVALAELPEIRKISFTGSTEVGAAVAAAATSSVKRVTLELGGNDPAIVLEDADLEATARGIVGSAFRNAGQVCMAVKRVYVPRAMQEAFTEVVVAEAAKLSLGHGVAEGTTMGPMHTAKQRQSVQDMVDAALHSGGRLAAGGGTGCDLPGHFMNPTIIANAAAGMALVDQEQFGSALPIIGYDSVDEAMVQANSGPFGLGASLWTPDLDRAEALASNLEAGTVWINQHTVVELDAPFGGWKASGTGRERGRWGLEEYLEPRTINARSHG